MTYYTIKKDSVKRPIGTVKGLLLHLVQSWCQKIHAHSRGTCAKLVSKGSIHTVQCQRSIHTVQEALVQSWCQKDLFTRVQCQRSIHTVQEALVQIFWHPIDLDYIVKHIEVQSKKPCCL